MLHLNYLVSKAFKESRLAMSPALLDFLQACEPYVHKQYPQQVGSNDFRYLLQSMFFTKEYHDFLVRRGCDNYLYKKTLKSIRSGYQTLLEGPHNSYNINKVCRVLSAMEGPEESALLKEIVTAATAKLEKMDFNELVHLINMVFPYIHREQILLWNRARHQMQNANPFFD